MMIQRRRTANIGPLIRKRHPPTNASPVTNVTATSARAAGAASGAPSRRTSPTGSNCSAEKVATLAMWAPPIPT